MNTSSQTISMNLGPPSCDEGAAEDGHACSKDGHKQGDNGEGLLGDDLPGHRFLPLLLRLGPDPPSTPPALSRGAHAAAARAACG